MSVRHECWVDGSEVITGALYIACRHLQTHKEIYSTSSMDFGIKCVTVYACVWVLFLFFYFYHLMTWHILIIGWVALYVCGIAWITREDIYPIGIKKLFVETSVDSYPMAHSRHTCVEVRKHRIATWNSNIKNSNQYVSAPPPPRTNQWTTVITLK